MLKTLLRLSILGGLLFTLVVGCGPSGPPVADVDGVLLNHDGKPLDNILVQFFPAGESGITSSGMTNAEGKFSLKTSDGRKGAALGANTVVLIDNALAEEGEVPKGGVTKVKTSRVHLSYNNLATSDMKVTVEASKKNYELKITKK